MVLYSNIKSAQKNVTIMGDYSIKFLLPKKESTNQKIMQFSQKFSYSIVIKLMRICQKSN